MEYILSIIAFIVLFATLATAADLAGGHLGLVPLCYAALYGLGAYSAALAAVSFGASFWVGCLVGSVMGAFGALIVATLSLRLREDFFVIGTLGFQILVSNLFSNLERVTNGSLGIKGVPRPTILGLRLDSNIEFIVLGLLAFALTHYTVQRVTSSPFGRIMHAIREDEALALSLGKNVPKIKIRVFALSGSFAGLAGVIYAHYITFIEPTSFSISESVLIISMMIIGGAASTWGPALGASVIVILPEALRWIGFSAAIAGNLRQILYGLALVILMHIRPRGLVGNYDFSRGRQ